MGLLRALQARGYEVVALVPFDQSVSKLREAGIPVHEVPMAAHGTSPVGELRILARYFGLLRRLRPAAYLGFTIKPNIYGSLAASCAGVPVLNNVTGLGIAFSRRGALQSLVRLLYRPAFRKSRRVFFQNRESLELFRSSGFVNDSQIALIPGSGTDLERFAPSTRKKSPDEPFTFLLASRLLWPKGISEYSGAARLIRDMGRNARFQLLGGIEPSSNRLALPKDRIARWQEECGIEYLGSTDDVRPFFARADCIVLPSYYPEGVPRTLIEGAAMGKPLITTDMPGCRDVLVHGETGFVCEPRSVEALASAMLRMLDCTADEASAMGSRGRQKAEREFDERLVIDAYLDALSEIEDG